MAICARAYAKLNWSLDIVGRTQNGYHLLDMYMQSVTLCDELRFERDERWHLTIDGMPIDDHGDNLVLRAGRLLQRETGVSACARMKLTKRIPVRAGLGGGSADCAAALLALNRLWGLNVPHDALARWALSLGADVPFCLKGGLARATGLGETLESIEPGPAPLLLVVQPTEGLDTGRVFSLYDQMEASPRADGASIREALARGDHRALARHAKNALAAPAKRLAPVIGEIEDALLRQGACFAQMTGSGSAVVGAFSDEPTREAARRALNGRYPFVACASTHPHGVELWETP